MARAEFRYRGDERTIEDVNRRAKQSGSQYDSFINSDVQLFKAREGECQIRILPATWQDVERWGRSWEVGVYLHYDIGPDGAAYLCLDKMKGEPCPICEAKRLARDEEEADALRFTWRALCWMIDRDKESAGPMVWSMPITLFRDINARCVDRRTNAVIKIDHPEHGYDVLFNREGAKQRTKYTQVDIEREATPIHDDIKKEDKWLDYIMDNQLPDLLKFYDYEYIKSVLYGKSESRRGRGRDEEQEEEEPRRSRRANGDDRGRSEEREEAAPSRLRRGTPEEEERPSRRRAASDEPPFDPDPPRSRRRAADEEEEAPPRRRAAPEDEEPPPRRRSAPAEQEDEPPPRRRSAPAEAEEEPPPRRRAAAPEPEDEPPARRRSGSEDGGEAPPPRRRAAEPEAEEPPPRRRSSGEEAEHRAASGGDEPPPRRRRAAVSEEAEGGDDATTTARRQLDRLKDRG